MSRESALSKTGRGSWHLEQQRVPISTELRGPMLTAYNKILGAERLAGEDNNSMAVHFLLHYHKTCVCVCVFRKKKETFYVDH